MKKNQPTKFTLLGTLVDRAVCMPYAKPQVLRDGRRRQKIDGVWETTASIRQDVAVAADFLRRSLKSPDAQDRWSPAALALDPAGPWWPKTRDDFFGLGESDRDWILDRLFPTAVRAAACIELRSRDFGWTWIWSQPPMYSPGKLRPKIILPDLIGGLDWKKCEIIDLKVTTRDKLTASVQKAGQGQQFEQWSDALSSMGFKSWARQVLVVSAIDNRHEWISF